MTGPVLRTRAPTTPPPSWKPVRRANWARDHDERCSSNCGEARRCMLLDGHDGLHAWRSLGALRTYEWG